MAMPMPGQAWVFRARAVKVVDGDTLDVRLDVGFHAMRTERLRLLRVDAPELRGAERPAGLAAREFVVSWLTPAILQTPDSDWPLVVQTYKSDEFGRYLAEVWRAVDGANLNDDLLASGHATLYAG